MDIDAFTQRQQRQYVTQVASGGTRADRSLARRAPHIAPRNRRGASDKPAPRPRIFGHVVLSARSPTLPRVFYWSTCTRPRGPLPLSQCPPLGTSMMSGYDTKAKGDRGRRATGAKIGQVAGLQGVMTPIYKNRSCVLARRPRGTCCTSSDGDRRLSVPRGGQEGQRERREKTKHKRTLVLASRAWSCAARPSGHRLLYAAAHVADTPTRL